jgi:hypothetical protein
MQWLYDTTALVPRAIMSNCAMSIKKAACTAYKDIGMGAPHHLWCTFHVLKNFKKHMPNYLHKRADAAIEEFQKIMYSTDLPCDALNVYLAKWVCVSPGFAYYVSAGVSYDGRVNTTSPLLAQRRGKLLDLKV